MSSRVLRIIAVSLVSIFGLGTAAFIAGETFNDPGGWKAALWIAAWGIPLVVLSLLAVLSPDLAVKVLPVALAAVATFAIVDEIIGLLDRDAWGPVGTIAVFTVAIPSGLLGLHRAAWAGWLLIAGGAVQILVSVLRLDTEGGQHVGSALGGSAGSLIVPLWVAGMLFLAAAAFDRPTSHQNRPTTPPTRHAH